MSISQESVVLRKINIRDLSLARRLWNKRLDYTIPPTGTKLTQDTLRHPRQNKADVEKKTELKS